MSATSSGGKISDDAVAAVRARIGTETTVRQQPYLEEATKDAIRHWARAIGDKDPKWQDADYARKTRFSEIIAPPSILYAFSVLAIGDRSGLPGIHAFFGGADHEWYLPIRRNDAISLHVVLKDLIEKESSFSRRMFQQISEVTFTNQRGEVVARSWPWGMRTERSTAKNVGKYDDIEIASYTPDDIEKISEWYGQEEHLIRGATPRYWEDVVEGEQLPAILRGPWTATTSICFLAAHGGLFMMAHGHWYDYIGRHPRAGIPNAQGIPEGPVRGHWDSEYARQVGVPAAYDYGPERIAWLCSFLTYWCGDDGWLRRLRAEIRRFNLLGDLTTISGQVTKKYRSPDGVSLVDVDLEARDQRGVITASGNATIELPVRLSTRA